MRQHGGITRTTSRFGSGGGYQMRWRRRLSAGNGAGALFIEALQFEVDRTDVGVERSLRGYALLGRPALVIGEVRFHHRHPPMARPAKRSDASRRAELSTYHW